MGFAQEQIVLSTVFMYGILVGLVAIVYRTNVLHKAQTYSSWWLTKVGRKVTMASNTTARPAPPRQLHLEISLQS